MRPGCGQSMLAADLATMRAVWRRPAMMSRRLIFLPMRSNGRGRICADSGIKFEVADIFDLPDHWRGRFDLVHETYNLQAMPNHVAPAIDAIASLVAPGGTLLVMTRGRHDDEQIEGPPRPLTKKQLQGFEAAGLECRKFEEFYSEAERPTFHYLAEYVRPADD